MTARLLLVHSPLVGPATWDQVEADLAGEGYEVSVPDLTGTVMAGPPYALRLARWLPPWSRWWGDEALAELIPDPAERQHFAAGCPRLPLAMFEEIHPPAPQWPDAPAAYLQLSEAYQDEAARARELGWPVTELMSHHLAPLTDPGRVAGSLRELIGRLG